ncbi:hypothetical protein [Paenibacillus contaminans]|jgi:hypothetical protein|nr:hypothetical protein [Paenibacillus contaminans]
MSGRNSKPKNRGPEGHPSQLGQFVKKEQTPPKTKPMCDDNE